ncbi:phage holin family protein [Roseovarius sp. 2305UL8-3]|uniref:phage holin family protein n=1 Tax=Roseovarius conchicola TaxID=3121636 RepID=UPI003528DA12
MDNPDIREAPQLLTTTLRQFFTLVQNELKLARAEMSRNLSRAGTGLVFFGVAALLALVALNVLASALVAYIAETGLSVGMAALIVGGGLLALACILALVGKQRLSADAIAPSNATRNLKRDIESIKETTHG